MVKRKRGEKTAEKGPFKGFFALPVALDVDNTVTHHLFYKKQAGTPAVEAASGGEAGWEGANAGGGDRSLFVVNVPWNWDYSDLQACFSCFGSVESAVLTKATTDESPLPPGILTSRRAPEGGRRAIVTFETTAELEATLTSKVSNLVQPFQAPSAPGGMEAWLTDYDSVRPDVDKLQIQVDRFMEAFDVSTSSKKRGRAPEVDEEGWTMVGNNKKKQRRNLMPREVLEEESQRQQKKKKGDKVVHFYKFQQRQEKKDQLAELRRKFEEDKAKLAKLKEQREKRGSL
jgi:ribosomal RNA-processing protein 7